MNNSELEALHQPIHNDAKLLYCLGLKPVADRQTGVTPPLEYKKLLPLLNGKQQTYKLGRQLNALIKQLVEAGLVNFKQEVDENRSFNGKQLVLPLMLIKQPSYDQLHMQWCTIEPSWQPETSLYNDLASLVGIIDKEYNQQELGEFIAYWLGRPEANFSLFQWTQKFVFHIKKKRLSYGKVNTLKVGQQQVKSKPALSASSKAKQLVEKYSGKH